MASKESVTVFDESSIFYGMHSNTNLWVCGINARKIDTSPEVIMQLIKCVTTKLVPFHIRMFGKDIAYSGGVIRQFSPEFRKQSLTTFSSHRYRSDDPRFIAYLETLDWLETFLSKDYAEMHITVDFVKELNRRLTKNDAIFYSRDYLLNVIKDPILNFGIFSHYEFYMKTIQPGIVRTFPNYASLNPLVEKCLKEYDFNLAKKKYLNKLEKQVRYSIFIDLLDKDPERMIPQANRYLSADLQKVFDCDFYVFPPAECLNEQLDRIISEFCPLNRRTHPIVSAASLMTRMLSLHPMANGHGRTGTILMQLMLMRSGYPPVLTFEHGSQLLIPSICSVLARESGLFDTLVRDSWLMTWHVTLMMALSCTTNYHLASQQTFPPMIEDLLKGFDVIFEMKDFSHWCCS